MKLEIFTYSSAHPIHIPIYSSKVKDGFPSPAENYISAELDLNEFLIKHPAATFFVKVSGISMTDEGIHDGNILIVDRALTAKNVSIVIVILDGEFTVKKLKIKDQSISLLPANNNYQPIHITEPNDFEVWGVVTSVIHQFL